MIQKKSIGKIIKKFKASKIGGIMLAVILCGAAFVSAAAAEQSVLQKEQEQLPENDFSEVIMDYKDIGVLGNPLEKKTTAAAKKVTTQKTPKPVTKNTSATSRTRTKTAAKPKTTTTKATTQATTVSQAQVTAAPRTYSGMVSYTQEEFNLLAFIVQHEVGNMSEQSKIAVTNVILNRVKSPMFPNTINEVLTAPGQFTAYQEYPGGSAATENTISCVQRALNGEDNSNGATYYYAPKYCGVSSWFESLNFCMELEGQRFFY
ncbi:MAG: cell wall hydrolase [Oscillospiraceae bacterium]